MRKVLYSFLLAITLLFMHEGMAAARSPDGEEVPLRPLAFSPGADQPALSLNYAQVINGGAPIYARPTDAVEGRAPVNWLAPGFVFVSLAGTSPIVVGKQKWYRLEPLPSRR